MLKSIAILAAVSAVQGATLKPVLKLRGGLAGIEPELAAKVGTALMGSNAAMMYLAPEKAAEMYGVDNPSPLTSWFCEVSAAVFIQTALAAWLAIANGMDFTTAVAWGSVPSAIQAVKFLLNDTTEKLGFGASAKYVPPVVNIFFMLALFGKVGFVAPDLALKIWSAWGLFNGVFCYASPSTFMKNWDAPLGSTQETAMAKFFGQCLMCSSAFPAAVCFGGKSVLEGLAWGFVAFAATDIDANFISEFMEDLGADKSAGVAWLVIEAAVAACILL